MKKHYGIQVRTDYILTRTDGEEIPAKDVALFEASEELLKTVKEAQWLRDHIMGKEKRVNWGDTFDIDWGRLNNAFIMFDATVRKAEGKV